MGRHLHCCGEKDYIPDSFKIGKKFENYVRDYLFIERYYDLLERTPDFRQNNHRFIESTLKPDFTFRDHRTGREFYVEAKFRTGTTNGKIIWSYDAQLQRYFQYNKEKPVFIVLGMGDKPKYPEFLTLIPLDCAKYTGLFPSYAEEWEIDIDEPIKSKVLWNR